MENTENNNDNLKSAESQPDAGESAIAILQKEVESKHQDYLRALADFENFKKRAAKERSDLIKYQGEKIITAMLDVLDNLELALANEDADVKTMKSGLKMIHQMFVENLNRWEVRAHETTGKLLDPNIQEAISSVESAKVASGTVIQEFKKAYSYKDRLIRPGQVVVAK